MKAKVELPQLTEEQVERIIEEVSKNINEDHVNYDSICCASDGISSGIWLFKETFRETFGIKVEWPEEENEEDYEDIKDEE